MKIEVLIGITAYGDIVLKDRFAYIRPDGREAFCLELYEYDESERVEKIYPEFTRIIMNGLANLLNAQLANRMYYIKHGPLIRLFDGYPPDPICHRDTRLRIGEKVEAIDIDVSISDTNGIMLNNIQVATLSWGGHIMWQHKMLADKNIKKILYNIIRDAKQAGKYFGLNIFAPPYPFVS